MALILRPYQEDIKARVYEEWRNGHKNVLLVMPTGMGKTKTFSSIAIDFAVTAAEKSPTAILVHRKELVQQISLTLAEEGIVHNIIAAKSTIMGIIGAHRRILKKQFYSYTAPITVVSVDTLKARINRHENWAKTIRLWITDEAAHLLANNKWGQAVSYFPNAIGLGVTATPRRLDKKGLGRHADGVFDIMVEGPSSRWGIENGFLCKYKIAIPPSDYQSFLKSASQGSDYSKGAMFEADRKSQIIGDVVKNYQRFSDGKQAILFCSGTDTGLEMEKKFKAAGITAKLLTAESADKDRLESLIAFQEKKLKILLNVDLFDEGLDVPGIETVIMARPTMSLSKFLQMIGRGLRPAKGKNHLILIDHVGNVIEHGLPDQRRIWTLDRIIKRRDKTNFMRICSNSTCNSPYDRAHTACPWCGTEAILSGRGGGSGNEPRMQLKQVDGDLELIDPEILHQLQAECQLEDPANTARRVGFAAGPQAAKKALKAQQERIDTQRELAHAIAKWAGLQRKYGMTDRMIHKQFYLQFDATITEKLSEPTAEMLSFMEELRFN